MPILQARDIRKTYGAVVAVDDVSFEVEPGSVHALLGENGAGKSTLVKIMSGAVPFTAGTLLLDGSPVRFRSTAEAARRGVAIVSQELNLFGDLDVLANLFPVSAGLLVGRRKLASRASPVLGELGLEPRILRATLGRLPLTQRQLVEIARALLTDPRVLILDEPTSALDRSSTGRLLRILSVLRSRDVGVVFVSHILEDVMAHSDLITVLRDGRVVLAASPAGKLTMPVLVEAMLGDKARDLLRPGRLAARGPAGPAVAELRLSDVTVPGLLADVSLSVGAGQITGLAGLAGAGQSTVLELVAGLRRASSGTVRLPGGRPVPHGLPACIDAGVALVSGDRRRVGLMLDKPIWENMAQVRTVALGRDGIIVSRRVLRARAKAHADRLGLRYNSLDQRAALLSGGNQQKVVFAKWLDVNPSVLLLDDPTRGVDVGARAEMHALIRTVAAEGAAVLMCSTDLDELAAVCDRVVVLVQGQVAAVLSGDALTEHAVLEAMNGGLSPAPSPRLSVPGT